MKTQTNPLLMDCATQLLFLDEAMPATVNRGERGQGSVGLDLLSGREALSSAPGLDPSRNQSLTSIETPATYPRFQGLDEVCTSADQDLHLKLLDRLAVAQKPFGRCLLNLHLHQQRLRAEWLAHGTALVKRTFDIVASLAMLICLSPLFLVIAVLVWIEDGGPVFFTQTRVGRYGREFRMYKIRSMCLDAEQRLKDLLAQNQHQQGVTFKLKDDPRITRVGKWLRKLSFDELPQFFNVFIGDMSLVGPRPPVPREVAKYSLADRRRLAVKPGITCIWQISGRSEIDFSGQVELDVNYIESQSFWKDLIILARTVPAVLSGKGAC